MMGPQRAAAEERHGPRPREPLNGEPEAVRIRLLGGFRVLVGSRSIGGVAPQEGREPRQAARPG